MEAVREYIISLTAASILCGAAITIAGKKGSAAAITKLLCGILLTTILVKPILNFQLADISEYVEGLSQEGQILTDMGESAAAGEMDGIIKSKTEAYILDKAAAWNVTLDVEVELENQIPVFVHLQGAASPFARAQLSAWISENIGIPTEGQQWTTAQ